MSGSVVEKWGKDLAITIPSDLAREIGLAEGETVEIERQRGNLVIRRLEARTKGQRDAETAASEIIADGRRHSLGGISIRDLVNDGRR